MSILDRIKTYKLEDVAARKRATPRLEIEQAARLAAPSRPFAQSLQDAAKTGYGLIAEIKKASPSKGLIRADFDPVALALAYQNAGATCLSVLTDAPSFQGHDDYLRAVRAAVDLPILRKDFLYDPWQVIEARALGADCILIIMASVSDDQARELEHAAQDWQMDSLIEVHSQEELDRALKLQSRLIGVNNRDLNTFETDIATTAALARHVPEGYVIVSESGIRERSDLAQIANDGVRCFLVGESLMRHADVAAATRELLRDPVDAGAIG